MQDHLRTFWPHTWLTPASTAGNLRLVDIFLLVMPCSQDGPQEANWAGFLQEFALYERKAGRGTPGEVLR